MAFKCKSCDYVRTAQDWLVLRILLVVRLLIVVIVNYCCDLFNECGENSLLLENFILMWNSCVIARWRIQNIVWIMWLGIHDYCWHVLTNSSGIIVSLLTLWQPSPAGSPQRNWVSSSTWSKWNQLGGPCPRKREASRGNMPAQEMVRGYPLYQTRAEECWPSEDCQWCKLCQ